MEKRFRWVANLLAVMMLLTGLMGFLGGLLPVRPRSRQSQYPLGDLSGVAVDGKGRVYCAIPFYGWVQVYSSGGRFLFGIDVETAGQLSIQVDSLDILHVAVVRQHTVREYKDGTLISEKVKDEEYSNQERLFDAYGNQYLVRNPLFMFPHVVKVNSEGRAKVLISVPPKKWVLMAPFPAIYFLGLGLLWIYFLHEQFFKELFEPILG